MIEVIRVRTHVLWGKKSNNVFNWIIREANE